MALLAAATTALSLFLWPTTTNNGESSFSFTTVHGQVVKLYGRDPYRYDSLLVGAGFHGADYVILFLGVPTLLISTIWYQRGSLRGTFLLMGTHAFFSRNCLSMTFGASHNCFFLVCATLFSTSLFALMLVVTSTIERKKLVLTVHISSNMPHRRIAIFLFMTGLVFVMVWMGLDALLPFTQGQPPQELAACATLVTH